MRRRVVVTGAGWATPLGCDLETVWRRLLRGESGVGYTTLFDARSFPTRIAAEVRDLDESVTANFVPAAWQHGSRHTKLGVYAAVQAFRSAGLEGAALDPSRCGTYLGSGEGQQDFGLFTRMIVTGLLPEGFDIRRFAQFGLEVLDPVSEMEQEPNLPAAHLAGLLGFEGPNANCLTACAASSQALGEAVELIRRDETDVMLSGGCHSMIHPFGVTGFNLLTALSTRNDEPQRASRPFDRDRDGFVLGEGAAMLILEELEHARRRGAPILGEIVGYGSTADAYRVTDTHPEGRGAASCLQMALADAQLNPADIHYINAHGTSTDVNDRVESLAIKKVFGPQAYRTPVSSTKSMLGHLIAAAGATELIICLLALRDQVLPPTINYENPDPDCDLDYIPNQARPARCTAAASNSFGFGGQNITLIAAQYAG